MIIVLNSLTQKGFQGLTKYFPDTTWFKIRCKVSDTKIHKEIQGDALKIVVTKNFSSDDKDKTFVVWIVKDLKREQELEVLIDYTIEVEFK